MVKLVDANRRANCDSEAPFAADITKPVFFWHIVHRDSGAVHVKGAVTAVAEHKIGLPV